MVTYQAPGVYVQEVPSGSRPIEGIGTSVAAFVGFTEKGPRRTRGARHELDAVPGDVRRVHPLVHAAGRVRLLHERRRQLLCHPHRRRGRQDARPPRVARTLPRRRSRCASPRRCRAPRATTSVSRVEDQPAPAPPAPPAGSDGAPAADAPPPPEAPESGGRFRITVRAPGYPPESFEDLSLSRTDPRYVVDVVNAETGGSILIMRRGPAATRCEHRQPRPAGRHVQPHGGAEPVTAVSPSDFQGDVARREGIDGLEVSTTSR